MKNLIFSISLLLVFFFQLNLWGQSKPNVILILTDDQGIGDLGCHGNPWLKTPNIDKFYEEAVRFTDFHVSPLCTPTRASIMTGLYPINNGAWATYKGRDIIDGNTPTIADIFKENGYKTALFGKWHLGDNYPSRPTDSGFDYAIHHLAGGIGELSDYWGNSYFDDVYYVNNQPQQFEGYCTDIWFKETMKYIDENKEEPFFIYLPLNAPHDPLIVDEKYAAPYRKLEESEIVDANLYGMIANIDENFGKLRQFLKKRKLEENTIIIYMSDNGTRFGYSRDGKRGYNMGLEGIKGDKKEGGHRVPFFIKWPKGKIEGGKDITTAVAHVDLLPTLTNLCSINLPKDIQLDGIDIAPLFRNKSIEEERAIFIHNRQDWRVPEEIAKSCIIYNEWRLINGDQLYDINKDKKQSENIASENERVVEKLKRMNHSFWKDVNHTSKIKELPVQIIGNKFQEKIKLTIQHAIGEDKGIWKCQQVADGIKNQNNTHAIAVEKKGYYKISCRRWPLECTGPINGIPAVNPKNLYTYHKINPQKVRIRIANQILEKEILDGQEEVNFKIQLEKGKTLLTNDFVEGEKSYGVYYTYVSFLGETI